MNDVETKVGFLAHYVETVSVASQAIKNDHLARVFGRALFLGLDAFLVFAPVLKNSLRDAGKLDKVAADGIKAKIEKLRTDYNAYYATLRDKLGAHQQEVALDRLLDVWNEIDKTTLAIFASDIRTIYELLSKGGLTSPYPRPRELDDGELAAAFGVVGAGSDAALRVGIDRVALTRPGTAGIIAGHPTQEKGQRIVTAFDNIRSIIDNFS